MLTARIAAALKRVLLISWQAPVELSELLDLGSGIDWRLGGTGYPLPMQAAGGGKDGHKRFTWIDAPNSDSSEVLGGNLKNYTEKWGGLGWRFQLCMLNSCQTPDIRPLFMMQVHQHHHKCLHGRRLQRRRLRAN